MIFFLAWAVVIMSDEGKAAEEAKLKREGAMRNYYIYHLPLTIFHFPLTIYYLPY